MDKIIKLQSHNEAHLLCGMHDANFRLIEKEYKVKLNLRGEHLKITGSLPNIKKATLLIEYILGSSRSGEDKIGTIDLSYLIANFKKPKKIGSLEIPEILPRAIYHKANLSDSYKRRIY